jgi:hypothetical protein
LKGDDDSLVVKYQMALQVTVWLVEMRNHATWDDFYAKVVTDSNVEYLGKVKEAISYVAENSI